MNRGHSSLFYLDKVVIAIGIIWWLSGDMLGALLAIAGVAFHFIHPED